MKYIIILSIIFSSCKRLTPLQKSEKKFIDFSLTSIYLRDGGESLFEKYNWYHYNFITHSLISSLDIFAIYDNGKVYYFQIEDIYDPNRPADDINNFAYYSLNIKRPGINEITTLKIDAFACNVPQVNPDHANCLKDPIESRASYLNLETLAVWKMSADEAKTRTDWHLAFRDEVISVNGGENGPGDFLAGLAHRKNSFFSITNNGQVIAEAAAIKSFKEAGMAQSLFNEIEKNAPIQYFLPKGTQRVISEKNWYREDSNGKRSAIKNYWLVKSAEDNSYFKLSIDDINQVQFIDGIYTDLTISYFYQAPGQNTFFIQEETLLLPRFKEGTAREICIDLDQREFSCQSDRWDLRFEITDTNQWFIWTKNKAIPLLGEDSVRLTTKGIE